MAVDRRKIAIAIAGFSTFLKPPRIIRLNN
jgi:hypothetical protein